MNGGVNLQVCLTGAELVGEGGKITLWIPSDLAYGTRGAGRDIGPNEALQFDVEVIEVIPYDDADDALRQGMPVTVQFGDEAGHE